MSAATGSTQPVHFASLLRRIWPKHTAKMAAHAARCSVRTSQKWLADVCDPSAETLIRLAQGNAALRAELIQILEGEPREVSSVDRRVAPIGASGAACGFGGCPALPTVTGQ